MGIKRVVAAASLVLGLAAGVGAIGTIITTGSDIAVGAGTTAGTITIDPAFPLVAPPVVLTPDPLGPIGAMTGSLPGFPGAGTGADGIYDSGTGATLAAGTYNFTQFTVQPDAAVVCDGPVVIRVTGNANIAGLVHSFTVGAGISLHCGGDLTITGGDVFTTNRGIETSSASSPVDVHAMGDVRIGSQVVADDIAYVTAASGAVTVTGGGAGKVFEAGNAVIESSDGIVLVRAAASMELTGFRTRVQSSIGAAASQMLVQAFGGPLSMDNSLVQANNFSGSLVVEASAGITVVNNAAIRSVGNPSLFVSAFGGSLLVDSSGLSANAGGAMIARASTGITFSNGAAVSSENGPMAVVAHGGNLDIQPPGSINNTNIGTYHGNMLLAASGSVLMGSGSYATSFDGRTDVDAFGDIVVDGAGSMRLGSFIGDLEVVAGGGLFATVDASEGPSCVWRGGAVRIHAGSGGADLDVMEVDSEVGDLDVIAAGPVEAHERLDAEGNLSVESAAGNIDLAGATLVTAFKGSPPAVIAGIGVQSLPPPPMNSGDILVWCHLQNGAIDATDAFLHTGDSPDTSGSVSLLVNGASPPVASFILPKNINAKVNGQDPSKSRLVASGFLDTGPEEVDLSGPATVDVGDLSFEVAGFTPNRSGTKYSYKSTGLVMSITVSKAGSSRAKFRLLATGAFSDAPGLEERITLRFSNPTAEGFGIVDLDAGRYTLGRKRGALVEPNISLFKAKATLKGSGNDALSLKLGLATNGITPETAPDVHIGFGIYETDINGGTLVPSGDKFIFHGPPGGVTLVILDYLKETITIQAKGVDLGEISEGSSAVPIRIGLGGDERIVTVRMGRKGPAFVY